MATQMVIRIDEELKEQSARLARQEGKSLSELVRDLLAHYTREHSSEARFDRLWDTIGHKLVNNGVTEDDVADAIAQVRADND